MQIVIIPGVHHSQGVRGLDSARETVIGHCGQSLEGVDGWAYCNFLQHGATQAGTGPWRLPEKDPFSPRGKELYSAFFFSSGTHRTWNVKLNLYSKYHLALKITKSIGMDSDACTAYFSKCATVCLPCTADSQGIWAGPWRTVFSFGRGCWWKRMRGQVTCRQGRQK